VGQLLAQVVLVVPGSQLFVVGAPPDARTPPVAKVPPMGVPPVALTAPPVKLLLPPLAPPIAFAAPPLPFAVEVPAVPAVAFVPPVSLLLRVPPTAASAPLATPPDPSELDPPDAFPPDAFPPDAFPPDAFPPDAFPPVRELIVPVAPATPPVATGKPSEAVPLEIDPPKPSGFASLAPAPSVCVMVGDMQAIPPHAIANARPILLVFARSTNLISSTQNAPSRSV
jgi:hypothetical protein